MKIPAFLLPFLFSFCAFGQVDTLDLDLDKAALDMKKCRKYIHLDDFKKIISPSSHLWTKADSIFFGRDDSLYLRISQNGHLRLEGLRLYDEMVGKMMIYDKKGKLVRKELRGRLQSTEQHNGEYVANEMTDWMHATDYKNGVVVREAQRSIGWEDGKGWQLVTVTEIYRGSQQIRVREKRITY